MNQIPFVDLAKQHEGMRQEIMEAVDGVLSQCDFILGDSVGEFEEAYARFIGTHHAIGVANGLDALQLSLAALGVGRGDEVILPVNTFIATAFAVSAVGATPVFVDCDPATYNIDPDAIEATLSARTKALIPVHLTGQSADMDPIVEIAERHGLVVVEDAAQAHGTRYNGRPCGSIGAAGCFSFYPSKNLGALGDGGIVTCNDSELAQRIRELRNYGQRERYRHAVAGTNSRLDTVQAAVLNVKLRKLPEWNDLRVRHAALYSQLLAGVGDITVQTLAPFSSHVYHLFIVETDERDALQAHLKRLGINTGIHYPIPIHLQEAYADLGYKSGAFPHAERLAKRVLSLPMFPELTEQQIVRVADGIQTFFQQAFSTAAL